MRLCEDWHHFFNEEKQYEHKNSKSLSKCSYSISHKPDHKYDSELTSLISIFLLLFTYYYII